MPVSILTSIRNCQTSNHIHIVGDATKPLRRPIRGSLQTSYSEDTCSTYGGYQKADLHFCVSEIFIILLFQAHKYFMHFMNNVNVAINGEKLIR